VCRCAAARRRGGRAMLRAAAAALASNAATSRGKPPRSSKLRIISNTVFIPHSLPQSFQTCLDRSAVVVDGLGP